MARFVFILVLLMQSAVAQVFGLPFGEKEPVVGVAKLLAELDELDVNNQFEDKYRTLILEIDRQLELKRVECTELPTRPEKEKCFRDIVQTQRKFFEKSYTIKKNYLKLIHEAQLKGLDEAHAKALKDLERQF